MFNRSQRLGCYNAICGAPGISRYTKVMAFAASMGWVNKDGNIGKRAHDKPRLVRRGIYYVGTRSAVCSDEHGFRSISPVDESHLEVLGDVLDINLCGPDCVDDWPRSSGMAIDV